MNQKHSILKTPFQLIHNIISQEVNNLFGIQDDTKITVELPRDRSHGDFATNVALVLSKAIGKNPREIAEDLKGALSSNPIFSALEIAGPGFINFRMTREFWDELVTSVYNNIEKFGYSDSGKGKRVLIEFVSANPTGPMHVGHSRGAVFGDALANLLKYSGYDVVKEYYVNDAGSQVKTLVESAFIRYKQALGDASAVIPEGMYPGEYLIPVGVALKERYGDSLLSMDKEEMIEKTRDFVIDEMMKSIRADLALLGVEHDFFLSEHKDLQLTNMVDKAISALEHKGFVVKGVLEAPKGERPDDWEPQEQTIFKSTEFGDDMDRVVKRADGSTTYFSGDLGLALNRQERGFKDVVMVLGADHAGYVKRIQAIAKALSDNEVSLDVPIVQIVNLLKAGEPFKMSKRAGNFITVEDVLNEVDKGVLRFVMLSRKNDTVIDFDFDKVKEQNKENPVFYVQYASARSSSILRNAKEELGFTPDISKVGLLKTEDEINIIKTILSFPRVVEQAAEHHEPHRLVYYIIELATEFHSFWSKGSDSHDLRFIIPNNKDLTEARLALVSLVKSTISNGLQILGIDAIDKM